MKHRLWFATAITLVLTLSAMAAPLPADVTAPASRKPAPEFTLKDAHGTPVGLAGFRGKVVLLNFWATWCHGCKTEIPWFVDFQNRFGKDGLAVVGVSMDSDGWKSVRPFVAARKLNYTIVIGDDALGKLYDLGPMPKTLLIDRDGRVAATYDGMVEREKCQSDIKALLAEK